MRAEAVFNRPVAAMVSSPRLGVLVSRNITILTYTGRRSRRTFSIPVGYCRAGDEVKIPVNLPNAKTWWRNFLGPGGTLTLRLDGAERAGHAVAQRNQKGKVTVMVRLTDS